MKMITFHIISKLQFLFSSNDRVHTHTYLQGVTETIKLNNFSEEAKLKSQKKQSAVSYKFAIPNRVKGFRGFFTLLPIFLYLGKNYLVMSPHPSIFWRTVRFFFKKNLLLTNSITSGGFMGIGDLIQQEIEYRTKTISEKYDWNRAGHMFAIGTLMGPLHHYYYLYLDKIMPKSDLKTVAKKVLCDQLIASPLTILFFFYGMGKLEKKSFQESTVEVQNKFKYVYLGDCLFWPSVQGINFYYLPTEYRVFYINLATMVFNVFLSYMKHFDQH